MKFPTDLRKIQLAAKIDGPTDDAAWLENELARISPRSESSLARLLLSRIAFDNMPSFCVVLDARGIMRDVNPAALLGAGLGRRDVHGKPFWEAGWWPAPSTILEPLKAAVGQAARGELVRYEADILGRAAGKERITVDFTVRPVRGNDGVVRFLVCEGRDVTEQRRLEYKASRQREASLRLLAEARQREKLEGRFRLLVESVVDYAIYMLDPTGVITNWNAGAQRIKGYSADEVIGQNYSRFFTDEDRAVNRPGKALDTAAREGKYEAEGWRVRKDGTLFWASVVIDAIRDKTGELVGFAKITRDVTERRNAALALQRTQEQLAQAQKMQGIGLLTGGVAHDFNNLLAIIMGNIETLQRVLQTATPDAGRLARAADNAMRGAQRAAALTQRLLAFSRQQPLDPKVVEISKLVAGMSDLLRRSLGEQVVIKTVLAGQPWPVHVDPNQLEVAILNLAVNARDAMPKGGKLTIETANIHLDEAYAARQVEVTAGDYIVISVTDTGGGMTADVAARAFEPFYTTKDVGHGTGLGLSQVYGFVKQSGGHIKIYTEVGMGTTVKIYLPRLCASDDSAETRQPAISAPRKGALETILVVEDEEDVRAHTCEILRELGYQTHDAGTGAAALQILQAHPGIRLLFTDVGLPGGMNGRQLADEAQRRRSGLKVLFTTGYARNAILCDGRPDEGLQLIAKPFTYAALASKLRDILDRSHPRRVLLVEDDELIRLLAIDQLEEIGFEVEAAASATEAMDKLELINGDVQAAIIDIGLPDRKGDVLAAEIRAMYPSLPIVIASGYGTETRQGQFSEDRHIAFLNKPYGLDQLRKVLASLPA